MSLAPFGILVGRALRPLFDQWVKDNPQIAQRPVPLWIPILIIGLAVVGLVYIIGGFGW